jgi:hypothetical protein
MFKANMRCSSRAEPGMCRASLDVRNTAELRRIIGNLAPAEAELRLVA